MTTAIVSKLIGFVRLGIFSLALAIGASAFAQKPAAKQTDGQGKIILAINEGGSGNLDATEIFLRYEEFKDVIQKALGMPVVLVAVRDINNLRQSVETGSYGLVLSRPADILAEAVRDYGYLPVVVSKEPAQALFIVNKDSPIKKITDIKGKNIVTPDRYAYMWRIANAMLRDSNIIMSTEKVRSMRDQAAIGWSMENGFFDVGVVASFSGVGRTWEKKGGRIIAKSPEVPNTPLIASPRLSAVQIEKIRIALIALDSNESGMVVLKKIGIPGFKEASPQIFLDLLKWLGKLEIAKE